MAPNNNVVEPAATIPTERTIDQPKFCKTIEDFFADCNVCDVGGTGQSKKKSKKTSKAKVNYGYQQEDTDGNDVFCLW
jgi:hypothetical protein